MMKPRTLLCILFCAVALTTACSEDNTQRKPGRTRIESNPMMEVKDQTVREPKNADAWFHLADLYEQAGMYPQEAEALLKVIEIDPSRGYSYAKLGTTYNRLDRYDDAIVQFRKAAKLLPKNPVVFNNMAYAYGKTGKVDEQVAALRRAIAIRPSYATARFNLAIVYLHSNNKAGALQQYEALKKIDETAAESLKREIDETRKN